LIRNTSIKHDILKLVPEAKIYLRSRKDILFAYLFGSYARNKVGPLSDVDIAVYLTKDDLSIKKMDILGDLIDIFKTDEIDLVILNTAPLTLRMKILQNKYLLADNEPFVRHAYESVTVRSYFDFYKFEKSILERRYLNG
jgi:predicted nucleotidyltransferase